MNYDPWAVQIRVLEKMLKDRGYSDLRTIGVGVDPSLVFSCQDNDGRFLTAYVTNETKVGVKSLRKLHSECKRHGSKHLILLCPDGLTPFAAKEIEKQDLEELDIEIFRKDEMSFCVPRHCLVPPHTPLSTSEKKELLCTLGSKASCLPKLKQTDPVAKYYHYQLGTVVCIRRRIGTLEEETYFRLVVA